MTLERIADPAVPRGCLIAQSVIASPSLPPEAALQPDELLRLQSKRIKTALVSADISDTDADDIALQIAAANQSLAVLSRASLGDDRLQTVAHAAVLDAMTRLRSGSAA